MKKVNFEKFAANKVAANQIKGGDTPTTYDRADFGEGNTGTGSDKAFDDGCVEFTSDSRVYCGL
jgi:hypothetical protein